MSPVQLCARRPGLVDDREIVRVMFLSSAGAKEDGHPNGDIDRSIHMTCLLQCKLIVLVQEVASLALSSLFDMRHMN